MPAPPRRRPLVAGAILTLLVAGFLVATPAAAAGPLISQGKPATASSVENGGTPASAAVDGNAGTRWSSAFSDPQWIQVDLGATPRSTRSSSSGRRPYATAFQIQVSADGRRPGPSIYRTTTGDRRHPDPRGHRQRPLRAGERHRPRHRLRLLALGVPGLRHDRRRRPRPATAAGTPISEFRTVAASSWEGGNAPAAALDGRTNTRWSSVFSDPQWIQRRLRRHRHHQPGGAQLGGRLRAAATGWRPRPTAAPGRPSTATTTGARRRRDGSPSPAPDGTCGCTAPRGRPATATRCGSSRRSARSTPARRRRRLLSGPTRPPATTGQFALTCARRRRDGHHHPATRAVLGRRRRGRPLPGVDQRQPHRLRLRRHRQPDRPLHQGRRADRHLVHAQLGPGRPVDLQVVRHRRWSGATTTSTSAGSASTCPRWRPSPTASASSPAAATSTATAAIEPYEDWRQPIETRVNDLLGRMTAEEKAYQMFYNAQAFPRSGWHFGPAGAADLHATLLGVGRHPAGHPVRLGRRHDPRLPDHLPDAERAGRGPQLRTGLQARRHAAPGAARGRHPRRARPARRGRHEGPLPTDPGGQRRERVRGRRPGAGPGRRAAGRPRAQPRLGAGNGQALAGRGRRR